MKHIQRLDRSALWFGAVLLLTAHRVLAQGVPFGRVEIQTSQLAPGLFMLKGSANVDPVHKDAAGGTVAVLVGPDGALMVDAQYASSR
jgi:hypothetical protein